MAHYDCYLLDGEGHIGAGEVFAAGSDKEAVARAQEYLREHPAISGLEVFLDKRRVLTLHQFARRH